MKRHIDDLLPAYLTGTLETEEWDRCERHLAECEECRQALDEWRAIGVASRSAFAGPVPTGSLDCVWAAIDEPHEQRPRARRARPLAGVTEEEMMSMNPHALSPAPYAAPRRMSPVPWLVAGLVLLLAMGSFVWYSLKPGGGAGPEPMPAVQLAGIGTPQSASCPEPTGRRELGLAGSPEPGAIALSSAAYEGGFFVAPEKVPQEGEPADAGTVEAVTDAIADLTACVNEGDANAIWSLTTDNYVRRFPQTNLDPETASVRGIVPLPGPGSESVEMPGIQNVTVLPDGRVGAELRDPADPSSKGFIYYVLAREDGQWMIDEAAYVRVMPELAVTVNDSGFSPRDLVVPAPQPSTMLVLTNEGTTPHSLVTPEFGIRVEAEPGESARVSIKAPAGTYDFTSDIPGDDPDIFTGTITFEGEPQPEGTPVGMSPDAGSRAVGMATASATIRMDAPESYAPDRLAILADRDVEVTLVNDGTLEANFTIDALGISVDLEPGERAVVTVNAPEGAYAFYSTIPGHAQVGMTGVLMVQAAPDQP